MSANQRIPTLKQIMLAVFSAGLCLLLVGCSETARQFGYRYNTEGILEVYEPFCAKWHEHLTTVKVYTIKYVTKYAADPNNPDPDAPKDQPYEETDRGELLWSGTGSKLIENIHGAHYTLGKNNDWNQVNEKVPYVAWPKKVWVVTTSGTSKTSPYYPFETIVDLSQVTAFSGNEYGRVADYKKPIAAQKLDPGSSCR